MLLRELFLVDGYKEAQLAFSKVGNPERVKDMISKFRQLVDRNQVHGEERNVDAWRKKGWFEFQKFVFDKSLEQSKTQKNKLIKNEKDSTIVYNHNNITGVMPLNKRASGNIGRHSDWCTTKLEKDHWEEYIEKGIILIYCFLNYQSDGNGDDMWAIAFHKQQPDNVELFTAEDAQIDAAQFLEETGVSASDIINAAINNPDINNVEAETPVAAKPKTYIDSIADLVISHRRTNRGERNLEIEYALLHFFDRANTSYAYQGNTFSGLLRAYTAHITSEDMKNMNSLFQTDYLQVHPNFIEHISNPTDEQIEIVIKGNPWFIKSIPAPTRNQIHIALQANNRLFYDLVTNPIAQDVYADIVILRRSGADSLLNAVKPNTLDPAVEMKLAIAFPYQMYRLQYLRPKTIEYLTANVPKVLGSIEGQNINGVLQPFTHT